MKSNLINSRTCVYSINNYMVWSIKYRKKVLTSEIEQFLKELAQHICDEKGFILHLIEVGECDHVHCFVSAPPKISISYIIKMLKGISGRKILEKYPDLRKKLWKGELWNPSFYVKTIGSVSEENIRRYIENQKKGELIE